MSDKIRTETTAEQVELWYQTMLTKIEAQGVVRPDRISLTDQRLTVDLAKGLPLLSIKPTPWKLAIKELYWFISDSYDIRDLEASGVKWWKPWTDKQYSTVDQEGFPYKKHNPAFKRILGALNSGNPNATWLVCSLWPDDPHKAILPPCACFYQVIPNGAFLDMVVHQRSADLICGVPANLIQYAFLAHYYATMSDKKVGSLTFNYGDIHIYKSHLATANYKELTSDNRRLAAQGLAQHTTASKFKLAGGGWPVDLSEGFGFDKNLFDGLELDSAYYPLPTLPFEVVPVHIE